MFLNRGDWSHARPIRCPRCHRRVLILIFDSPITGVVCRHCHEELMVVRMKVIASETVTNMNMATFSRR